MSAEKYQFLIAGLGNPGRQYQNNRHNVGFMALDELSRRLQTSFGRLEHKALVSKVEYQDHGVILAKPQTFMNLSGQAVSGLQRFYKIALENLLVVYDDVDLSLGTLRLRPSGGSAGQKGVASIINRLGSQDFPRLRIGIGRPPGRMGAAAYVLKDFSNEDREILDVVLQRASDAILEFVATGLESAMNKYNGTI